MHGSAVFMNKDVHHGISLKKAKMKLCPVSVVCFPPSKQLISLQTNSCDPPPSLLSISLSHQVGLDLKPLTFMFICFIQFPCTAMFYCSVVFYWLKRLAKANNDFRFGISCIFSNMFNKNRFLFHYFEMFLFESLVYCHMSLPDNEVVYLREDLQSLDVIGQRITLSQYTLSLST